MYHPSVSSPMIIVAGYFQDAGGRENVPRAGWAKSASCGHIPNRWVP
jgi:hypothetical protein